MCYSITKNNIYLNLYTEDLNVILLKARLTCKIQVSEKNVAYMIHTKEDVKDYGLDRKEFMQLSMSHKFWVLLSKISYVIVCRMRNFCKVGL